MRASVSLFLLLANCFLLTQPGRAAVERRQQGILVTIGQAHVEVSAVKPGIFRLSVAFGGEIKPNDSIFVDSSVMPVSWEAITQDNKAGVKTRTGQLLVDQTNGDWSLLDATGRFPIARGSLATELKDPKTGLDCVTMDVGIPKGREFQGYGSGNGGRKDGILQSNGNSRLGNGIAVIPYYWCTAGYAALGVSGNDDSPARWQMDSKQGAVSWAFPGRSAELYLMPAEDLHQAAQNYANLSGYPLVPPRWAFGYLQSRWGWRDKAYIEDTLKTFRYDKLPVDGFIFDFESYTPRPDYDVPPQGIQNFPDFSWNPLLFPDPARQIANYRAQGIHVVPIRKPRIGDSATLLMMKEKGWMLPAGGNGNHLERFDARDINFENPDVRSWYAGHLKQMLEDGVAGWWNDEGESTYTKYYWWNKAEYDAEAEFKPNMRYWTINRAFQPGLQRFGGAAWTGDIPSTWRVLAQTPANLLDWSLAGMPYGACDIGGFQGVPAPQPGRPGLKGATPPEMMTRWMQMGVFLPVMRTHSNSDITPHFPWLYGADAENAIRKALELRYRLIPYYYSLAHEAWSTGAPLMRPLVMEFPDDPKVADLADQWLMGRGLMAAPVLAERGERKVYFPDDMFTFEGTQTFKRGEEIDVTARLDEIPVYVRAGTIVPLGPIIQDTDQLPGGPLEVQVYPGRDASFTLVEDDGVSYDYQRGIVRKTNFKWNDAMRTLSWKQEGDYHGKEVFTAMRVVVFDTTGKKEKSEALGVFGNISFKN